GPRRPGDGGAVEERFPLSLSAIRHPAGCARRSGLQLRQRVSPHPSSGVIVMAQRATKRQVNRLPPEQRIADIMRSAREVFTEKGYSESLISDIAERAGVV